MTYSARCRFRTITRSRYLSLSKPQREAAIEQIYWDNLNRLQGAISFCAQNDIRLYRMPSGLFPMSDEALGERVLHRFATLLSAIGRRAKLLGIRIVMHPDQFVVLSSESPAVVRTSVRILEKHAMAMDLMGLPRSAWSTMIIHGGKSGRGEALCEVIEQLPTNIRSRLSLENDEYAYSAADILSVCKRAGVPMVFDNHHHLVHERLDTHDHPSMARFVRLARGTWPDPGWQLVHLSNGQDHLRDPRHSQMIAHFPKAYRKVPWIEVEAKGKEEAIAALRGVRAAGGATRG